MKNAVRLVWSKVVFFVLMLGTIGTAQAVCSGGPQIYTCLDETDYRNKLVELGYSSFSEGFEDDAVWGGVRTPNSAPSVTSQNTIWTTNHLLPNAITTGLGAAFTGSYGIYDIEHGSAEGTIAECDVDIPPENCLYYDGFTGTRTAGASTLYGVGGYIRGSFGSKIELRAGANRYELGQLPDTLHHFFGVIDTNGFSSFQVREIEGKIGQKLIIFGDDFTFGVADTGGNTPPVAVDDAANAVEDTAVVINVLTNDSDADGDALSIISVTPAATSTVVISPDRTQVTYTPALNLTGGDSFTYTISDGNGGSATATVTVTVAAVNDAPTAADDAASTSEDTAVTINVLANDNDVDGDALTISAVSPATIGTVDISPDQTQIIYTPAAGVSGADSFTYTISDGNGGSATATVSVTVNATNDAPVAVDDTASTTEDTPVTIDVLANDSDIDGDSLVITAVGAAASGTVEISADRLRVTYTPALNFTGTDSFTYNITDLKGGSATATVTVTVGAANDAPVAVDDTAGTAEDTAVTIPVLANDTDAEGDALIITAVTPGANGSAAISADQQQVTYTPAADFNGLDSFTYTISDGNGGSATATVDVTVSAVNDAPVAADDSVSTAEDTAVTIPVLANDTDADGDTLSFISVTQGANGTVDITPDQQQLIYTPAANFTGPDSFTYTITDGNGGNATATVNVTVGTANDAPVAADDTATTPEDTGVSIAVLANDTDADGDALTISAVTPGTNGTVEISADMQQVTYTPAADFNGSDSFSYTISDGNGGSATGAVSVTVSAINDAPVAADDTAGTAEDTPVTIAVLANDTDADGDALTVSAVTQGTNGTVEISADLQQVTYTPAANFTGPDSFSYTISDGNGGSATATANVTVGAANDAPVAVDDSASTPEDTPVTIAVLANDTDADGDALTISAVTPGTNGTVEISADMQQVTYTPAADFNGSDSFSYTISDGNGGSATGAVSVTVSAVNDAPVAADDTAGTAEDTPVTVAVLANDTDVDGDALSISAVTPGTNGTVAISADLQQVTYTPTANVTGPDSFTYSISDGNGGNATATVNVTVNAANDAPVAVDDTATTPEDTAVTIAVLANDTDADGDALTITAVTPATNGTVEISADLLQVAYNPDADFNGPDSFSYTISDGNGGSAVANVAVTVDAANDAPVLAAIGDMSVAENVTIAFTVVATDIDGDNLFMTSSEIPLDATFADNGNGTADFFWTPSFFDSGNYRITFFATDDGLPAAQDFEEIVITVGDVNRPPKLDPVGNLVVAENDRLEVILTAVDEDGDAVAFSSSVLPVGASLTDNNDGTALLTWMPAFDQAGVYDVTLFVTDNGIPELTDSEAVTITVGDVNQAPVLNPIGNRAVDEGQLLEIMLIASDGDAGDLLSFSSTVLPTGASLTDNGDGTAFFSWTATFDQSGVYPVTFFVSDNGVPSLETFEEITITVGDVNRPPVLDPIGDRFVLPDDTLGIVLSASDPENSTLSFTSSVLPAGANLIDNGDGTAAFSWTPSGDQTGEFPILFTVADSGSPIAEDSEQILIFVEALNRPPVISPIADVVVQELEPVTINITASDPDLDALTITMAGEPVSASLLDNGDGTAVFTWTPSLGDSGVYTVDFSAFDGLVVDTVSVTITVQTPAPGLVISHYVLKSARLLDYPTYEYKFQAMLTNQSDKDYASAKAKLIRAADDIEITEGRLTFADVAAGATVTSQDMFIVRSARRYRLDVRAFAWDIVGVGKTMGEETLP